MQLIEYNAVDVEAVFGIGLCRQHLVEAVGRGIDDALGSRQNLYSNKLGVSRQAIFRWEMVTAMPDATNILQLSRLFQVTTDYLLNDEYQSDNDLPKVKEVKTDGVHQIMIFLITLEVMVLIIQFMSVVILQNIFFGVLSLIPFIAMVGGFKYAYQKRQMSRMREQYNSASGFIKSLHG